MLCYFRSIVINPSRLSTVTTNREPGLWAQLETVSRLLGTH